MLEVVGDWVGLIVDENFKPTQSNFFETNPIQGPDTHDIIYSRFKLKIEQS
jgi:hypothetical protein